MLPLEELTFRSPPMVFISFCVSCIFPVSTLEASISVLFTPSLKLTFCTPSAPPPSPFAVINPVSCCTVNASPTLKSPS